MKRLSRSPAAYAAALALLLNACAEQDPLVAPADDLLWHVPADTAYVIHNRAPLPAAFTAKWLRITGDLLGWYRELLAREMGTAHDGDAARFLALADALLEELERNMSPSGLDRLGLRADGRAVVFADGLLPGGRHEIADRARVWSFIERLEQRLAAGAERRRFGAVEYLRVPFGAVTFLLGIPEQELVWALVRREDETARLPLLFGDALPPVSLAGTGAFGELLAREGFPGFGDGYVDLRRLFVAARTSAPPGQGGAIADPACSALAERLLEGVPRLVFGTTAVSGTSFSSRMLIETDAVVGERLAGLAHPVRGLGESDDALFAFGMGVEIPRLRGGLRELLRYLAAAGGDCPAVNSAAIDRALPQLEVALGPMTAMFKGMYLELLELEMPPGGEAPAAVSFRAVAEVDDPRGVFAMAGLLNPSLAQLEVPTDGTPTPVPADLLPAAAPPLAVAIRDRSLALGAGPDGARLAGELVAAEPLDPPPLLVASYDVARFAGLMGALSSDYVAAIAAQRGQDPGELMADLEASRRMYAAYDRASLTVTAGRRGLQVDQTIRLK